MGNPISEQELKRLRSISAVAEEGVVKTMSSSMLDRVAEWIAVAGGLGYAPLAPGTAGSLAAALLFAAAFLPWTSSPSWTFWTHWAHWTRATAVGSWAAVLVLLIGLGVWSANRAEQMFGQKDDGRIVIDEVAGQWIALAPLLFLPFGSSFLGVVTGFVLFRVFDIWKPGAVRVAERRFQGGWGVMADDLMAGLYAAAVLGLMGACWAWAARAGNGVVS